MQFVQVKPISYPVNLIATGQWSQRIFYGTSQEFADAVHNMEVLEDDVWLVTIPKSGTTWMQELLWLLLNNCNFEAALSKDLELRSPFVEFDVAFVTGEEDALKRVEELPSPRLIKTHLPLAQLPAQLWQKKAKVVFVTRNPKDVWVSGYHHRTIFGFPNCATLAQFVNETLDGENKRKHIIEQTADFYQLRNEPWIYYTSFERMKRDLRPVIEDLCRFLNRSVTDQQMERLLRHLSFEEMKKNPTTNHNWEKAVIKNKFSITGGNELINFVRSGKVNGYKDELSPELIEKADRFIAKELQKNNVTLEELLLT